MKIINTNTPSRRPIRTQFQNGAIQKNTGAGSSVNVPNNVGYAGQGSNVNFSTNFTVTASATKNPGTINVELGPNIIIKSIIVNGISLQTMANGAIPNSQIQGGTLNTSSEAMMMFSNDASPAILYFAKSRGTSIGSYVAVQNGDSVVQISAHAVNGSNALMSAGYMRAVVNGAPGSSFVPLQWQWAAATATSGQTTVMTADSVTGLVVNFQVRYNRQGYLNYPSQGATASINLTNSGMQYCSVSSNSTLALSGGTGGDRNLVVMKNTGGTAVTVTLPTGITTSSSSSSVTLQPNAAVLFEIVFTGSVYFVNAMSYASGYVYP